jgi:hypothetical protein
MKKIYLVLTALLLLVSCSRNILNNQQKNNIKSVEKVEYTIDLTANISLPEELEVTFDNGEKNFYAVTWKNKNINYNGNTTTVVEGFLTDFDYKIEAIINFKDYFVGDTMRDDLYISKDNVALYYTEADEYSIKPLLEHLNKEYLRIINFFGLTSKPLMTGFIYPNVREVKAGNLKEFNIFLPGEGWGAGVDDKYFTMISPLAPPVPTPTLDVYNIATHEMFHSIHAYQVKITPEILNFEQTPIWLREGLATYLTENFMFQQTVQVIYVNRDDFILSDLSVREVPGQMAYQPGAFVIMFLLENYGYEAFKKYLYSLNFEESFGKNEMQLSNDFRVFYMNLWRKNRESGKYYRNDYP